MSSESVSKLKSLYTNIKNFYILDVAAFIKDLNIDMNKASSIYLANVEIERTIIAQSKLKKYKGIIYVNKHISEDLYYSFKRCFEKKDHVKIVLIDNGQIPKHTDIMDTFDEVIFFERFRKNKIVECEGFKSIDTDGVPSIIMDETD